MVRLTRRGKIVIVGLLVMLTGLLWGHVPVGSGTEAPTPTLTYPTVVPSFDWPCPEDAVLVGHGEFTGKGWTDYTCTPLDDLEG